MPVNSQKKPPHPVDVHVGKRLQLRRNMLGLSRQKLGEKIGELAEQLGEKNTKGLTFQQIAKYEHGQNRVSASRLWQFAKILEVKEDYFFEGLDSEEGSAGFAEEGIQYKIDADSEVVTMDNKETMTLIRAYYNIEKEGVRKKTRNLIKAVASSYENKGDTDDQKD